MPREQVLSVAGASLRHKRPAPVENMDATLPPRTCVSYTYNAAREPTRVPPLAEIESFHWVYHLVKCAPLPTAVIYSPGGGSSA